LPASGNLNPHRAARHGAPLFDEKIASAAATAIDPAA
jgi:hypothetical protein